MRKLVTDPRFIKAKQILESCESYEQMIVAIKFARLVEKRITNECNNHEFTDFDSIFDVRDFAQDMITKTKERIDKKEKSNEQNEYVRVQKSTEQSKC